MVENAEKSEVVTLEDHLALVHHVLEILLEPNPNQRVDRSRERVLLTMAMIATQQARGIVSQINDEGDALYFLASQQGLLPS